MVLPIEEFRAIDANAVFRGASLVDLMERAGAAVAEECLKRWPRRSFAFFCGTGNNGGDGFVAARLLSLRGRRVHVYLVGEREKVGGPAARALEEMEVAGLSAKRWKPGTLVEGEVVVDAILGSGLSGPLREPARGAVEAILALRRPLLCIDIPTGLRAPDSPALRPEVTVTVLEEKAGMREHGSGTVVVADIGFPAKALTHVGPGQLALYYPRGAEAAHKGDNGRLLVVAGSAAYTGAPVMASHAALRTGVDLVIPYLPEPAAQRAMTHREELVVHALRGDRLATSHLDAVLPAVKRATCVLAGPGCGDDPDTLEFFRGLLVACAAEKVPAVVDAEALQALPPREKRGVLIVTPHRGEMVKLSGIEVGSDPAPQAEAVRAWAEKEGLVAVVKGPVDLLTDGKRVLYNDVHHPSMTMGGTGDVLAGSIAALVARGLPAFRAAQVGAFLVGAAGLEAFEAKSWGVTTTDVIEAIPAVLKRYL